MTEKSEIDRGFDFIDDEVLREAFGIEVYRDLLNPHSILVEGASDKRLLQKAFSIKGISGYGVTNGHGSNIDTLASKLNDTDISILVILDDDNDGKAYKEKIIKIDGSYSAQNVTTIRDLVGGIVEGGTIEDALDRSFVESKMREQHNRIFKNERYDLTLDGARPVLEQIKSYLHQQGKDPKTVSKFLEDLKIKISEDFNPSKEAFSTESPFLDSLATVIQTKLDNS